MAQRVHIHIKHGGQIVRATKEVSQQMGSKVSYLKATLLAGLLCGAARLLVRGPVACLAAR